MAIIRLESFDYYGLGQEAKMSDNDWPVVHASLQNTQVRTGTLGMYIGGHSGGGPYDETYGGASMLTGSDETDIIVGFAAWHPSLPSGVTVNSGVAFRSVGGITIGCVAVNSDGTVSVWRRHGSGYTLMASSSVSDTRVLSGTWNYFEIKLLMSTNECHVRLNNQDILSVEGAFENIYAPSRIIWDAGNDYTAGNYYLDDIYVCDTIEADPSNPANDWLGDVRVFTLSPNGTGAVTQWSPVGSTPNWSCVDEIPTDDDSTYVQGTAVGLVDSYQMSDLDPTVTGVIRGVQIVTRARKTDSGDAQIRMNVRSGLTGNAVETGEAKVLTTDYSFYRQSHHVDPQSEVAFTIAGVNAMETQIETVV